MSESITPLVVTPDKARALSPFEIGGKAAALAAMAGNGFRIPQWKVVTTTAFRQTVGEEFAALPIEELRNRIRESGFSPRLQSAINEAAIRLTADAATIAVRSSAVGEDSADLSHAGQLESYLCVDTANVERRIRDVWRSAFSDRVLSYRSQAGLPPRPPGIAVLLQAMIPSSISGVAFGADPISGNRDRIIISAAPGLGEGLVSGEIDADRLVLKVSGGGESERSFEIIEEQIAEKLTTVAPTAEGTGTRSFPLPPDRTSAPAITHAEAQEIASLTARLNEVFGAPQDVEWSIAQDQLYVLQSRPITNLPTSPEGTRRLWDNSNIIESYSGVTTPMTFSFIEGVYREVYMEFCRTLGVSNPSIEANSSIFWMLGLIRGRVYYNLLNWYRLLALLPGYRLNAAFMEGMMGVSERLEERPRIQQPEGNEWLRVGKSLTSLVQRSVTLKKEIPRFMKRVDDVLQPYESPNFRLASLEDFVTHYRHLERQLLQQWRTPIVNDFFTMIFHGLLRKLVEPIAQPGEAIENDLIARQGDVISTVPTEQLQEIARKIGGVAELSAQIGNLSDSDAYEAMMQDEEVAASVEAYLGQFGFRYPGELKLETVTPREEPHRIIPLIRPYLLANESPPTPGATDRVNAAPRTQVDEKGELVRLVTSRLPRWKRPVFRKVLAQAAERVRQRENLRFERGRVFSVIRTLLRQSGEILAERGTIDQPQDVFMLRLDELFAFIEGRPASSSLREVIQARRAEFESYRSEPSPPDRFETLGSVGLSPLIPAGKALPVDDADAIRGTPCSPGIVTAPARIVTDPENAPDLRNAIMVAERTDPGWTPLFAAATGILVERGSLLSHSAIVAREMGIPAIVAIPRLLDRIDDGAQITMNGGTGDVTKE